MATMKLAAAVRNSMAEQIEAAINAAVPAGYINFYTGTMPTNGPADAATGSLIATLPLSTDCGSCTGGVLTFGTITADSDTAAGTIGYARIFDGADVAIVDFDVTTTVVGTGAIQLSSTVFNAGDSLSISSFTITLPLTSTWTP